jgi:hypothetical protein
LDGGVNRLRTGLRTAIGVTTAATLLVVAAPASGVVTLGHVGDPTGTDCGPNYDFLQPNGSAGNSYTVPGAGMITSWTMFGAGPAGQMFTLKIFRKVAEPSTYQAVGRAGPQTLTLGGTAGNTFPASIRVGPGDVLGFYGATNHSACGLPDQPHTTFGQRAGDLADGQSDFFPIINDGLPLNLQATFVPDNNFKLASISRNKKKGTATLSYDLPNPGTLRAKGSGAKVSFTSTGPIGGVRSPDSPSSLLLIKATGAKRRTLNETGKVKLKLAVTYTPTGGDPKTIQQKLKLKKLV